LSLKVKMNKQIITKVSVLIDKLSFINNNNDFNHLNSNDIDFKLLKSYSKELFELLNSITDLRKIKISADEVTISDKKEPPESTIVPILAQKPSEKKQDENHVNAFDASETAEDELHIKPISDNIFDTVHSIKQKSKITRLNRLQFTDNEIDEEQEEVPIEKIVAKIEPVVVVEEKTTIDNDVNAVEEAAIKPSFIKEVTAAEIKEEENLSLNDRFTQPTESVADKMATADYKNLKELIDINDRFLFIQKLFGGSYLAFEESVNQINNIANYSEALDYIDYKIKSNFDWDNNAEEVSKFLNILEKKYN